MTTAGSNVDIYVVSSPHGGSTLFSHVLGRHPDVSNLGEVSFLPKLLALDEPCSCSEVMRDCRYWSDVLVRFWEITGYDLRLDPYSADFGDAPKGRLGSGLVDRAHQTWLRFYAMKARGAVDTVSVLYAPRFVGLKSCSLPRIRRGVENTLALYDAARAATGVRMIIDASKMPRKAAHLYVAAPERVRIVHLTRDGRGVVASRKRYMPVKHAAKRWSHYHRLSLRLLDRWVPENHRLRVSYEEFASAPERCLREIFAWVGMSYSEDCLDFATKTVSHSAGGNPARFHMASGIRGVDETWRESLTAKDLETFARFASNENKVLGYES
jgi:hypothetical protein